MSPAGLRAFAQLLYKGEVNEPLIQEVEAYDLAKLFGLNVSLKQKQSSGCIEENDGGSPTADESYRVDDDICQVEGAGQEEGTTTGQDDERMEEYEDAGNGAQGQNQKLIQTAWTMNRSHPPPGQCSFLQALMYHVWC